MVLVHRVVPFNKRVPLTQLGIQMIIYSVSQVKFFHTRNQLFKAPPKHS
jgi:hypothetical protein